MSDVQLSFRRLLFFRDSCEIVGFFIFYRWTVNLALQTANEFFKSPSLFDSSDLAQVFPIQGSK